jgi:hypothetical protein
MITNRNRYQYILLALIALSLAALACGTGYRTTKKITGNSGSVRVQLKEASDENSTSVEINEDWTRQRVTADVTFSLEAGSCRASILGEDSTAIVLDASPGIPAQASGQLVTNAFGNVTLETNCQGGQNLDLTIAFQR